MRKYLMINVCFTALSGMLGACHDSEYSPSSSDQIDSTDKTADVSSFAYAQKICENPISFPTAAKRIDIKDLKAEGHKGHYHVKSMRMHVVAVKSETSDRGEVTRASSSGIFVASRKSGDDEIEVENNFELNSVCQYVSGQAANLTGEINSSFQIDIADLYAPATVKVNYQLNYGAKPQLSISKVDSGEYLLEKLAQSDDAKAYYFLDDKKNLTFQGHTSAIQGDSKVELSLEVQYEFVKTSRVESVDSYIEFFKTLTDKSYDNVYGAHEAVKLGREFHERNVSIKTLKHVSLWAKNLSDERRDEIFPGRKFADFTLALLRSKKEINFDKLEQRVHYYLTLTDRRRDRVYSGTEAVDQALEEMGISAIVENSSRR